MIATSMSYPMVNCVGDEEFNEHGPSGQEQTRAGSRLTLDQDRSSWVTTAAHSTATWSWPGSRRSIDQLRDRGFRFVTVSDSLALSYPSAANVVS